MSYNSYPREVRLKKRADFIKLQSASKAKSNKFYSTKKVWSKNLLLIVGYRRFEILPKCARLGITVTKKVDKKAVKRNFFKRIVREHFRTLSVDLPSNVDVLVIALSGATSLDSKNITSSLNYLYSKAGLLYPPRREKNQKIITKNKNLDGKSNK